MNSIKEEPKALNESMSEVEQEEEMKPSAEQQNITSIYEAWRLLMKTLGKFVYLKYTDRYIASLYTLLSYCFHQMDAVPYLYLSGAPASGKDELLKLFNILGFNPIFVVRMTDAAIKRAISDLQGIFLLDEADILAKNSGHFLLSIFLNGYKAGGQVYICDKNGQDLIPYSVFGPKVYATYVRIKNPALLSRSIIFRMEAPDPENRPKKLIMVKHEKALKSLAKGIAELFETTDVRKRIMKAYANLEEIQGIWGRDEELFSGMRAIAKVIDKEKVIWRPDEGLFLKGLRAEINKAIVKENGIRDRDLLHYLLVKIARMHIKERKERQFFDDRDTQVIVSVAGFMETCNHDEDSPIIGEKIRDHVAEQLRLPSSFRTEDLGKLLKDRHLLKATPKVKWVYWKGDKVQKTCYLINRSMVAKQMEVHEPFIDSGPLEIEEDGIFSYFDRFNLGSNPSPKRYYRTAKS
jgi:hypothetical protein